MTRETQTTLQGDGLLEAAAIALAGLTVVGALLQSGAGQARCAAPVREGLERNAPLIERPLSTDEIVRDMRRRD